MADVAPINQDNPIKVFPNGPMWVAMVGNDMVEAQAGFGRTPGEALENLLAIEGVWEATPHAVHARTCDDCGQHWACVVPYPTAHPQIECPNCGRQYPVEQDLM